MQAAPLGQTALPLRLLTNCLPRCSVRARDPVLDILRCIFCCCCCSRPFSFPCYHAPTHCLDTALHCPLGRFLAHLTVLVFTALLWRTICPFGGISNPMHVGFTRLLHQQANSQGGVSAIVPSRSFSKCLRTAMMEHSSSLLAATTRATFRRGWSICRCSPLQKTQVQPVPETATLNDR